MKAVIQRVNSAILSVENKIVAEIGFGLVCYLGIGQGDSLTELKWLAKKVAGLRIFPDEKGKMNLAANAIAADILVVSQFTLYGDIRNGFRPSFTRAEAPDIAQRMYEQFCEELLANGVQKIAKGVFAADMRIEQVNQGPVTIILDTAERKL